MTQDRAALVATSARVSLTGVGPPGPSDAAEKMKRLLDDTAERLGEMPYINRRGRVAGTGDLWAGNCLVDVAGANWLIDPAAHYAHREFDLAMMALFGGFGAEAFASYDETHPLADGWQAYVSPREFRPDSNFSKSL